MDVNCEICQRDISRRGKVARRKMNIWREK